MIDVNLLMLEVDTLNLSIKANNVLASLNVLRIGDLVVLTEDDLIKDRNCGRRTLNEIKQKLGAYSLSLGMSPSYSEQEVEGCIESQVEISSEDEVNDLIIPNDFRNKSIFLYEMSVRTKGVLITNNIETVEDILAYKNKNISSLKNCGAKTKRELVSLMSYIKDEVASYQGVIDIKIDKSYINSIVFDNYQRVYELYIMHPELRESIFMDSDIFEKFFSSCFNDSIQLLREREMEVFESRVLVKNKSTLQEIGSEMGVSRERIRQIEKSAFKKISCFFTAYYRYIKDYIDFCINKDIDPLGDGSIIVSLLNERSNAIYFLERVFKGSELISLLTSQVGLEVDAKTVKGIVENVLENHNNFFSYDEFEMILMDDYGYSRIQSKNLISEMNTLDLLSFHSENITLNPFTKYSAVANIALSFPNGIPWEDLANVAKEKYKCCRNIRSVGSPDCSISDNPNLYNSGRGAYRHIKFFDINESEIFSIEEEILKMFNMLDGDYFPLRFIQQKSSKLRSYDIYDLIKICRESDLISIKTRSGQSLLFKKPDLMNKRLDLSDKVLSIMNGSMEPWTSFDISQKILKSKSERHSRFILSELKKELKVYRFDKVRYVSEGFINNIQNIEKVYSVIKNYIAKSARVVSGSSLKHIVELEVDCTYSRFFYSSLALKVCRENGWGWVRGYSFKDGLSSDFSLESYALEVLEQNPEISKEDLVRKITVFIDIDPIAIMRVVYRVCEINYEKESA